MRTGQSETPTVRITDERQEDMKHEDETERQMDKQKDRWTDRWTEYIEEHSETSKCDIKQDKARQNEIERGREVEWTSVKKNEE